MSTRSHPIMELLDLLGKKWQLRILWELSKSDHTFRELQTACGDLSPTLINRRIKELQDAGLLEKREPSGYGLTHLGEELIAYLGPLNNWSKKWARTKAAC